jgi:hypothetical protein
MALFILKFVQQLLVLNVGAILSLLKCTFDSKTKLDTLIIGVCILLRVILTVNYNTFCFAAIDKVFYLVASVLTTCFGP